MSRSDNAAQHPKLPDDTRHHMKATHPHPEWKRLMEEMKPLVAIQTMFTYEELEQIAGIDIRSSRGRKQFEKFRQKALREWGIWFANKPTSGYYIAPPEEHPGCASQQIDKGRRRIRQAGRIATLTRDEGATPAIVAHKRALASCAGAILQAINNERKAIRQIATGVGSDPVTQVVGLLGA